MANLCRDILYSIRSLLRTPALTATIVATIGLGLGATTGMTSVINAVLLEPLPYDSPGALVWIYTDNPPYKFRFSVVDYRALEADHPAFSSIAAYQTTRVTVSDGAAADRVIAKSVTGSYFPLLGQSAAIGRLFTPDDDRRRDAIAVLTSGYWRRHYGADTGVVGRSMTIDGTPHTIVGVLRPSDGPLEHDVAVFTAERWPAPRRKGPFFTTAIGRLRADVSREVAVQTLRATNARLFPIWRSSYQDEKATWGIQDLKARAVGDVGSTLFFVLAAVGCVLLIACANAVNLLIARALNRSRELAIRGALGASRRRLLQHLLAETGVLTAGAALVGLAVAAGAVLLVVRFGEGYVPRLDEVRLSGASLAWLGALAVASGVLVGLVPALHSSRQRIERTLGSGGRSVSDGPAARRLRQALVAAEFALATPLLVAAALVLVSLDRLNHVGVGIDIDRVLTAAVSLSGPAYAQDQDRRAFWNRALERLSALPGVESAAIADSRPPQDAGNNNNFDLEDKPTPPGQNQPISLWVNVSPAFFKTVGIRLERGRLIEPRDLAADAPNVIVVDRAWATRFFPGEEAIGRRLHEGGCTTCPWTTIVGVVGTVKFAGLDAPDDGIIYGPFYDIPNGFLTLRTAADPAALAVSLRQAVRELDPGLALTNVATGVELVADSLAQPRYLTVLVGMFALAALLLSIVGIYGVMSYFVQQHTRDIGIRLALGGDPASMLRMVVGQGVRLVLFGVVVGVGASLLSGRLVQTVVFGVSPSDPRILLAVSLALTVAAAAACFAPARRAAALDPAAVLRDS